MLEFQQNPRTLSAGLRGPRKCLPLLRKLPYRSLGAALTFLACAAPSWATTLTFDELAAQPVEGLSFKGVTFSFEVGGSASSDATYSVDLGLGDTAFSSDPVLEGDAAGFLTVVFSVPTSGLSFGLLLLGGSDYTPAAVANLYSDKGLLLDSRSIDTGAVPSLGISGGVFSWSDPSAGVKRLILDFDDSAGRFALDNLTYTSQAAPESFPLLGRYALSGLVLFHAVRRRLISG